MKKSTKITLAATSCLTMLLVASCSIEDDYIFEGSQKSKVTLKITPFGLENTAFTKASSGTDPDRLVFCVYDSTFNKVYDTLQVRGQQGYGSLSFELSPGNYMFIAVAHDVSPTTTDNSVAVTIEDPETAIMPESYVPDAFSLVKNVTIKAGVSFDSEMVLPRRISCFKMCITDPVPEGAKTFKIVANTGGAKDNDNISFDPASGVIATDRQYVREVDVSSYVGTSSRIEESMNLFLADTLENITVKATAYDKDGNEIITHTLENVDMKVNRKTIASGDFFKASGALTFSFATTWASDSTFVF